MKNLKILISTFIMVACMATTVEAQNYNSKISDTGIMTDGNGNKIGSIKADGTFIDNDGDAFGRVSRNNHDPSRYDFFDKTGKITASIAQNCTVTDLSGKLLYTVSTPDSKGYCKVYNARGKQVGLVHEKHKYEGPCMMHGIQNTAKK